MSCTNIIAGPMGIRWKICALDYAFVTALSREVSRACEGVATCRTEDEKTSSNILAHAPYRPVQTARIDSGVFLRVVSINTET